MISVGNIIFGTISGAIGFWFVLKANYINRNIYFFEWAEKKLGPGNGTTGYKLIGILFIVLGFFAIIGWIDLFGSAFGDMTNNTQPANQAPINYYQNFRGNGVIAP